MAQAQDPVQDELGLLLQVLPPRVAEALHHHADLSDLLEVVLDLGRVPEARFPSGDQVLDEREISREDLDYVVQRVGDFGDDNRAGIERTLHRISAIRNRKNQVVGITCRVGRAVFGTIKIIEDLAFSGKNILLLGRPGVGKTTMLRETARVLADEAKKRVVIVDTSNEIAGDGDVPHPAIGHARRMQVATPTLQHAVMIEAVENHMPQVIIIDEMGTEEEAIAARTIAERGVQLVATAHGNSLDNLIMNPTLSDLVGGIQTVTLGDQEARYRGTQKTVLERKSPPTFDVVVEIRGWAEVAVHVDVAQVVDQWLRGFTVAPELRRLDDAGALRRVKEAPRRSEGGPAPWGADAAPRYRGRSRAEAEPARQEPAARVSHGGNAGNGGNGANGSGKGGSVVRALDVRVFPFGVSRDKLEAAASEAGLSVGITNQLREATVVLTTKTHYRRGSNLVRIAESSGTPVVVLRKNTQPQVQDFLRTVAREKGVEVRAFQPSEDNDEEEDLSGVMESAMREAEEAAQRVLAGEFSVEL
ncbi:MAG: AAA family ATPase, partial [Dehalococcoidia bacterium]|nr:AAA family ATPase [Dehalococcoidia bacterium]